MGRLTLNVLLSFAQFEREVTSERIRDKISASKRKGLWVGGMAPLGYDTKDRRITVNEAEADRVRTIFRRYHELHSLNLLMSDLRKRGMVTKVRTLRSGEKVGGIPFTRGPLAHLLRNRFYIGEIAFKGEVLKGEQTPIVDNQLFEAVQTKLTEQTNNHKSIRNTSDALLTGRIFDDRGNRMTPSHARKGGMKYRYYLSSALLHGAADRAGSVSRVTAAKIEALVIKTLREQLDTLPAIDDRGLINDFVKRVEIQQERLVIQLADASGKESNEGTGNSILHVPWQKPNSTRRREVFLPEGAELRKLRPIRSENRATLIASIARGHRWLDELVGDPTASTESIAKRENCSVRKVNMTVSLAFLAPGLVRAAIDGKSGNPKRRYPARTYSTVEMIDRLFLSPVEITVNGEPSKVSTLEAILLQLWLKEVSGNRAALSEISGTCDPNLERRVEITFVDSDYTKALAIEPSTARSDNG
jgi:site-specific DNA recombinase